MLNPTQLISEHIANQVWNGLGYGLVTANAPYNQTGLLSWFNPYAYTNRLSSFKRKAAKGLMMAATLTQNPIGRTMQAGWAKVAPLATGFMTPIIEKVISPAVEYAQSKGLTFFSAPTLQEMLPCQPGIKFDDLVMPKQEVLGMFSNPEALSKYATKIYQYAEQQAPAASQFLLDKAEMACSQILNFAQLPYQQIKLLSEATGIPVETLTAAIVGIGVGGYLMYYLTSSYYTVRQNVNVDVRNQALAQNNVQVYLVQAPAAAAPAAPAAPAPAAVPPAVIAGPAAPGGPPRG